MRVPDIEIETITYHRNGVGGAGFFVVNFLLHDHDYTPCVDKEMTAVCFFEYKNDQYFNYGNEHVAVLERDRVGAGVNDQLDGHYRGDRFADQLLAACRVWSRHPSHLTVNP